MSYLSRIDHAFSDAPVLPLSENGRYVLFSDCHRGIGTSNDNFLKNQHLYFAALNYYYQHSFCYIELGDGRLSLRIYDCFLYAVLLSVGFRISTAMSSGCFLSFMKNTACSCCLEITILPRRIFIRFRTVAFTRVFV